MGTILIIIAIVAIALAVNVWMHIQKHVINDTEPHGQPINPDASVPGWELRSIPLGEYVVINGKKVEMCYVAIVNDQQPKFNYSYTVDFDYEFMTGKNTISTTGTVETFDTFLANGKSYFGVILAGAPGAKVTETRKFVVK